MFTRESAMPLCVGLIVAVMVHLAVLPAAAVKLRENYLQSLQKPTGPDPPGPERVELKKKARMLPRPERLIPKIEIGRHDAPRRPTGAWIPYDHFERLMAAKQAMTAQPALQKHSPPAPHAAVRIDASSPGMPTTMAVPRSRPEVRSRPEGANSWAARRLGCVTFCCSTAPSWSPTIRGCWRVWGTVSRVPLTVRPL